MTGPFHIEKIKILGYTLFLRDNATEELHEIELRGAGPWKVEVDGKIAVETGKSRKQVAPPPDDAITLRLVRDRHRVQIGAIGRGAKAWTSAQGTLLESRWELDPSGAPVAHLADRPTLVDELRAALPSVALDLSEYAPAAHEPAAAAAASDETPPGRKRSGRASPADREAREEPAAPTNPEPAPEKAAARRQGRRTAAPPKEPEVREEPAASAKPEPAAPDGAAQGRKKLGPKVKGLSWQPVKDRDSEGFAARWGEGQFTLLRIGGDKYGLFYEHDTGGFSTLGCGSLTDGMEAAGDRAEGRMTGPLDEQSAKLACGVEEDEPAQKADEPPPEPPRVPEAPLPAPVPEAPPPAPEPAPEANDDAALLRTIKDQLGEMLDEED